MNKQLAVHVAAETIVLGSLTVYLINRIGALEARLAEAEKDIQATARHTVAAEKRQVEVLNTMSHILKSGVRPPQPSSGSGAVHRSEHSHGNHTVHARGQPVSDKKKVSFSDADEDEETSEEEPTPPPKMKAKAGGKSKNIKVAQPDNNTRSRKDMASVRAAAAALAPSEDE